MKEIVNSLCNLSLNLLPFMAAFALKEISLSTVIMDLLHQPIWSLALRELSNQETVFAFWLAKRSLTTAKAE